MAGSGVPLVQNIFGDEDGIMEVYGSLTQRKNQLRTFGKGLNSTVW